MRFQLAGPRRERETAVREPQPVTSRANKPFRFARRRAIVAGIAVLICAVLAASLWYSWTNYFDAEYGFHMPIPFGWRANGYESFFRPGDRCGHTVDLIPPVSQRAYLESPPGDVGDEMITVFTPVTCRGWSAADQPQWATRTIVVSGRQATLYFRDDVSSIDRMVVTHFGEHEVRHLLPLPHHGRNLSEPGKGRISDLHE
jgi:hypothetical protein